MAQVARDARDMHLLPEALRLQLRPNDIPTLTDLTVSAFSQFRRSFAAFATVSLGIDLGREGPFPWQPTEPSPWPPHIDRMVHSLLVLKAGVAEGILEQGNVNEDTLGVCAWSNITTFFNRTSLHGFLDTCQRLFALKWDPSTGLEGLKKLQADFSRLQRDLRLPANTDFQLLIPVIAAINLAPSHLAPVSNYLVELQRREHLPLPHEINQEIYQIVESVATQASPWQSNSTAALVALRGGHAFAATRPPPHGEHKSTSRRPPICFRCGAHDHTANQCLREARPDWKDAVPESLRHRIPKWEEQRTKLINPNHVSLPYCLLSAPTMLQSTRNVLVYDTGCSGVLLNDPSFFTTLHPPSPTTRYVTANGSVSPTACGSANIPCVTNDGSVHLLHVPTAELIPSLPFSLLGRTPLSSLGYHLQTTGTSVLLSIPSSSTHIPLLDNGILCIPTPEYPPASIPSGVVAAAVSPEIAHLRIGHLAPGRLHQVAKAVNHFDISPVPQPTTPCPDCAAFKSRRPTIPRGPHILPTGPRREIAVDLLGRKVTSPGGNEYALISVDRFSKFARVAFLRSRATAQLLMGLEQIRADIIRHDPTGALGLVLRCDDEFDTQEIRHWVHRCGWSLKVAPSHEHELLGSVERLNQTLWRSTCATLRGTRLPPPYWAFALTFVTSAYNAVPKVGQLRSPFEIETGQRPDFSTRFSFGSFAWAHNSFESPRPNKSTGEPLAFPAIYLGPATSHSFGVAVLLNLHTKAFVHRRSFQVVETVYPAPHDNPTDLISGLRALSLHRSSPHAAFHLFQPKALQTPSIQPHQAFPQFPLTATQQGGELDQTEREQSSVEFPSTEDHEIVFSPTQGVDNKREGEPIQPELPPSPASTIEEEIEQSGDDVQLPIEQEVVAPQQEGVTPQQEGVAPQQEGNQRPRRELQELGPIQPHPRREGSRTEHAFLTRDIEENNPRLWSLQELQGRALSLEDFEDMLLEDTFKAEKIYDPTPTSNPVVVPTDEKSISTLSDRDQELWERAMTAEWQGHLANNTFDLEPVKIEEAKKQGPVLPLRWVFDRKADHRVKARLTARGDLDRTLVGRAVNSPTVTYSLFFLMASVGLSRGMQFSTLDFAQAYIKSDLDRAVFLHPPKQANLPRGVVLRLQKALYGLEDAAIIWHLHLAANLIEYGFKQSRWHPCLFRHPAGILMSIYVDDCAIFASTEKEIQALRLFLAKRNLETTVQHEDGHFLGMRYHYDPEQQTITFDMSDYIRSQLKDLQLDDVQEKGTPQTEEELPIIEERGTHPLYRKAVGIALHIAKVRPDIANTVRTLARHADFNTDIHWEAVRHLFGFLKKTLKLPFIIRGNGAPPRLMAYTDASWADEKQLRRGTSGSTFLFGANTFMNRSSTQGSSSKSSCQAELIALSDGAHEVLYLRRILEDLGEVQKGPTPIIVDSQTAIAVLQRPFQTSRTKHIDIRRLGIRELMDEGVIEILWTRTKWQLADIHTKALGRSKHEEFRQQLLNHKVPVVVQRLADGLPASEEGCCDSGEVALAAIHEYKDPFDISHLWNASPYTSAKEARDILHELHIAEMIRQSGS